MFGRAITTRMHDIDKPKKNVAPYETSKQNSILYTLIWDRRQRKIWNDLLFVTSSNYEARSISKFDDEMEYRCFIASLCIHMCGTGNTKILNYISEVTERCHSKL